MTVILVTTLSDGHLKRRVVCVGDHGADSVETWGKTVGDISEDNVVRIRYTVDTLEESEHCRVERLCWEERTSEILTQLAMR